MYRALQYLIALLIIIGIAYIAFVYVPRSTAVVNQVATSTVATSTAMTTVPLHEETSSSIIDVKYPQFGIPSVDTKIKSTVDAALAEFRSYPPNPPNSATPQNGFYGSFDSVYQGPDVVSVDLIISEDTGGAHPNTNEITVNVDPRSGHTLTLTDALSLIGKGLPQVADESQAQVKAKLGPDGLFLDGFAPKPENYSIFKIDKDNVTFIFNNYQVASYAAGPQQSVFKRIK